MFIEVLYFWINFKEGSFPLPSLAIVPPISFTEEIKNSKRECQTNLKTNTTIIQYFSSVCVCVCGGGGGAGVGLGSRVGEIVIESYGCFYLTVQCFCTVSDLKVMLFGIKEKQFYLQLIQTFTMIKHSQRQFL